MIKLEQLRIQRDLKRIENTGVRAARAVSMQLRAHVLNAYKEKRQVDIRQLVLKALFNTTRDSMVAAHLVGIARARKMMKAVEAAQSDVFKKVLEILARQTGMDIEALQRMYNTQALKVLNAAGADAEAKLRKTMNELTAAGAHVKEGIDALNDTFDSVGLGRQADYKLEAIFRTQTQLSFNAGRWQADQDPEVQEVLWGYQYSAVGDNRTRPEHLALDGTRLPKEDPFWQRFWPPNGWNCRCQAIPIFEEVKVVRPPTEVDGKVIQPDPGFNFNPGVVFNGGSTGAVGAISM